jgi:hypothetical protein
MPQLSGNEPILGLNREVAEYLRKNSQGWEEQRFIFR